MERLLKKFDDRQGAGAAAAALRPRAKATRYGVIYFGSTSPAMAEALDASRGRRASTSTRCACAPSRSPTRSSDFIAEHDTVFVVEQNRDAQLRIHADQRVRRSTPRKLVPVLHYDGTPITARFIAGDIAKTARPAQGRSVQRRRRHDLHRQAQAAPSRRWSRTRLGYTRRDYEGTISTLCAGCGHDSISAAIIQACWELDIEPHRVAKLSGIGCSSKTPTYFLGASHGFNTVHGRMPSVLTGANLANRDLHLPGRVGRRRFGLDRPRPVRPRHAARREHDLHRREQRRLRPDQGPVLGHRRPGLDQQEGRRQHRQPIDLVSLACSWAPPSSAAASRATSSSWCR